MPISLLSFLSSLSILVLGGFLLCHYPLNFADAKTSEVLTFTSGTPETCKSSEVDTTHLPDNRSQGNLSWCHSYVLADIFSFYAKQKISAYGIAVRGLPEYQRLMSKPAPRLVDQGASTDRLFQSLAKSSETLCSEASFASTELDWREISNAIYEAEKLSYGDLICRKNFSILFDSQQVLNLKTFKDLSNQNRLKVLTQLKCKESIKVPHGKMTGLFRNSDLNEDCVNQREKQECTKAKLQFEDEWFQKMNQKLDLMEPVAIFYDTKILENRPAAINKNYNHVSTLIGRRWNSERNTCEYLLRNTWGTDCMQYPELYRDSCKKGNIWIPQMDLQKSLGGVYFFEPEPIDPK